MNILVIGTGEIEQKIIELCQKSKFLTKISTASDNYLDEIFNITYESFEDLALKAKALQADIVIVASKELILQGIVEVLKRYHLNVISVNQKWFNLEQSRLVAKQLLAHYSINTPKIIKAPTKFPLVFKTNSPCVTKRIEDFKELLELRESLADKTAFLEEFLEGEVFHLLSLWDGKNIKHFDLKSTLTEVQQERLEVLQTKLNFLFSDEKADFIGFVTTKLIWAKHDWYVLDFVMRPNKKSDLTNVIKSDFLYLLNSAIYQKLDEI